MKHLVYPVLFAALLATAPSTASATEHHDTRTISVSGEGRVTATPDEADITLGIQLRGKELAPLRKAVTEQATAVLTRLGELGVEDRHVNGSAITVRPEYRWNKTTQVQELQGYFVQRGFEVKLTNLDRLADVLEGVADAGANEISPPRLGHSDMANLRRKALAAAAQDAKANAMAVAASLGLGLGDARQVSAEQFSQPMPMASAMLRMEADRAPAAEAYSTGDIVLESRVSASFELLSRNR